MKKFNKGQSDLILSENFYFILLFLLFHSYENIKFHMYLPYIHSQKNDGPTDTMKKKILFENK